MSKINACVRCGQWLRLVSDSLEEPSVLLPSGSELCPGCYRDLTPEERQNYFQET